MNVGERRITDRKVTHEYSMMVGDLAKKGSDIYAMLTGNDCHIIHMAFGISTEAQEIIELIEADEMGVQIGPEVLSKHLIEELGDVEFYIEGLCQAVGIPNSPDALLKDYISEEVLDTPEVRKYFTPIPHCLHDYHTMMLGLAVGGIHDYIKRTAIHRKIVPVDYLCYYLRTLMISMACIRNDYAIPARVVFEANMNKLVKGDNARYKTGVYSDEQAHARADKT